MNIEPPILSRNRRQKLDAILTWMANNYFEPVLGRPDDIARKSGLKVEMAESYRLLNILLLFDLVSTSDEKSHFFHISAKGILFKESGGFKQNYWGGRIKDFTKNYWYLVSAITFFIGLFMPWIQSTISQRLSPKSNESTKVTQAYVDSLVNNKIDSLHNLLSDTTRHQP